MCTLVHGGEETARAEDAAAALFGGDLTGLDERTILDVFADAPSTVVNRSRLDDGLSLVDALTESGMVPSKARARTAIEQGGAYVNNRREEDVTRRLSRRDLVADRFVVLRRGKRDYHTLRFD